VLDAMAVSYFTNPLLVPNVNHAAFVDGTLAFMNLPDLLSLMAKLVVTGMFVGVVCCYKGLPPRAAPRALAVPSTRPC